MGRASAGLQRGRPQVLSSLLFSLPSLPLPRSGAEHAASGVLSGFLFSAQGLRRNRGTASSQKGQDGVGRRRACPCRLRSSAFAPNDFSPCVLSASVVFSPATPGLQPSRLLCPWDSPAESTGGGCYFLLRGIFPAQGSNLCLVRLLHHLGSPFPP